ncbi:hypothetical protein LCGC14_1165280 [marine sediment metagenome]|uniref:FCP1 homology domain-containing protein n=1 Tax=marine sediment metagenome TaxID=412755 RepID=A0A0F9P9L5_9ZZZZ
MKIHEVTSVIFLDIDGVLNNVDITRFHKGRPGEYAYGVFTNENYFDPNCVACLNKIIETTKADIVISSTWRILFDIETLSDFFKRQSVKGKVIGCTGRSQQRIRGLEIQDWLSEHPKIKNFVILDDDSDMVHLMSHLVKTSWGKGLEEHHIDKAIAVLNNGVE